MKACAALMLSLLASCRRPPQVDAPDRLDAYSLAGEKLWTQEEAAFCAADTPSDVVALAPLCPWFPLRPTLDERPRSSLPFVPAEPLDLTS